MPAAMQLIAARFGHHVNESASRASKLRRKSVGHHAELIYRLERNREVIGFDRPEILAVEVVSRIGTVDREPGVVALLTTQTNAAAQSRGHLCRRTQLCQITVVAPGQRKAGNTLAGDEL